MGLTGWRWSEAVGAVGADSVDMADSLAETEWLGGGEDDVIAIHLKDS